MKNNVVRVNFRKQAPPKRKGLALTYSAGPGYVHIAARFRRRLSIAEVNELIRGLRDVRDDARSRVKRG
jgi:hypothetical protein